MKCATCRRDSQHDICPSCWQFAMSRLVKFPDLYYDLERELIPSSGRSGEKVSGSKTPPLPVRIETLNMRSGGISTPLMRHEAMMREARSETRITFRGQEINKITITCEYISKRGDWAYKNYNEAVDLATVIISTHNKIMFILGKKSDEIIIGKCPTINKEDEVCGTKLKIDPTQLERTSEIKCRRCGTVWESHQWRLLGKMLDAQN